MRDFPGPEMTATWLGGVMTQFPVGVGAEFERDENFKFQRTDVVVSGAAAREVQQRQDGKCNLARAPTCYSGTFVYVHVISTTSTLAV